MLYTPTRARGKFLDGARFHLAIYLISLARFTLWAAHKIFRIGLLDVRGVLFIVHISGRLRRLAWVLIYGKS